MRTRARERIICLSGQYPGSAPRWRRWRGPRRRSPIWPCSRWGFPCPADCSAGGGLLPRLFTLAAVRCRRRGGLLFCGTVRQPRLSPRLPACIRRPDRLAPAGPGYAASRPVEFGLSSPGAHERTGSDSPPFQNRGDVSSLQEAIQGVGRGRRGAHPDPAMAVPIGWWEWSRCDHSARAERVARVTTGRWRTKPARRSARRDGSQREPFHREEPFHRSVCMHPSERGGQDSLAWAEPERADLSAPAGAFTPSTRNHRSRMGCAPRRVSFPRIVERATPSHWAALL